MRFAPNMLALIFAALLPALAGAADRVNVNALNFARAETDMYFTGFVKQAGGLSKFHHIRGPAPIDKQDVVRMNRDTLYSAAVFDLDAGPVTIILPDANKRFLSLLVVNQDHYAIDTLYAPARHTLTRDKVGTRYVATLIRTFIDSNSEDDIKAANAAQDAIKIDQADNGKFEVPEWDAETHKKARDALLALNTLGGTKENRFGKPDEVDPVSWLLGTAAGWGGNPRRDAVYVPAFPEKNDGKTAYTLTLKDIPVDAFWSVTVYDAEGFMFENEQKAYSVNGVTAKSEPDGSVKIQFGGDPKTAANFLAIKPGWNYVIRLYRPRKEILDGSWKVPETIPVK